jgi:4-amino-4-deoxy-L-arabinose transferase-like glycosyltransferase
MRQNLTDNSENGMLPETHQSTIIQVDVSEPAALVPDVTSKTYARKSTFLILFVALLLNAAIVLVGLPKVSRSLTLTYSMNFGDLYDLIAKNLEQGNGYRVDATTGLTMLREPLYPFLLAVVFKLAGYGIQTARVVCVLLAFGATLLLLPLARRIIGDEITALVAVLLFLLYPGTLVAEARAGIEMPSIFTVILFMLALCSAVEKGTLWRYWVAGLLLGIAVLVRSQVLLFPFFLLVYLVFTSKGISERVKIVQRVAVLGFGALLVMSPWIIRNYRLVHKFIPTATVAGTAAQEGLYACENSSTGLPFYLAQTRAGLEREQVARELGIPFVGPYYQLFYTPQDEVAFNQALLNYVSTKYRRYPELLAGCAAKNLFFNFWFLGKSPQSVLLNVVTQTPLLMLALGGVVVLWRRGLLCKAGVVLLYILYVPVIQAPIIAHARHSMLISPFLAILGAVSIVSAWRWSAMSLESGKYRSN